MPVSKPATVPNAATAVLLLLQAPPETVSTKVVLCPWQKEEVPEMTE
jgi:hypothetical protein